jgi:hypothetical protein
MPLVSYTFNKLCATDRLEKEIRESDITISLSHIVTQTPAITITFFKTNLSADEIAILNQIVDNHVNEPLDENKPRPTNITNFPLDDQGRIRISQEVNITNEEQVLDLISSVLVDSDTVNFTYDDDKNTITANVIPEKIDHNSLLNYKVNEHINHSSVSINAGTGLTGGGDLTATRTLSLETIGTAGTYRSVTTDAHGRVVSGTNPTTLAEYGITDAQPLDGDLTAIANLNTNGFIVRTSANNMATRSLAAGTGLSLANADGVFGNPTLSLANTSVVAGSYGNATNFPTFTVDAQGRLTAAGTQTVLPFASNVKANGEVQTTSSNDILLQDMTITPPEGTYLIIAHTISLNTTNGAINRFGIYVGGNQVSNTIQNIQVSNNRHHTWSASSIETVNGSQAIEIRWSRNTGTAICFLRYISIIRVQ